MAKKLSGAITAKPLTVRTRAAARMRRSRSNGMRCYTLEFRDTEIAALVRRGLLAPGEQVNRVAIIKAMYVFLDRTLGRPI